MSRHRHGCTSLWVMSSFTYLFATTACLPTADELRDRVPDLADVDVSAVLEALFPTLTEEEIASLAAELSLRQALDLREELERAREAAAIVSRELFRTAEQAVQEREQALAPS